MASPKANDHVVNDSTWSPEPDQPPLDLSALTDREREIVAVAMSGASVAAIAETLSLSEATVRSHLAHIYTKLDVTGRIELLARVNGSLRNVGHTPPRNAPTPTRRLPRPGFAVAIAVAAIALILVAIAIVRPDLPPRTDMASVSMLLSERQVASLDLRGDRLFVATVDGKRFRVDGVEPSAVEALQAVAAGQGVGVSGGGDTDANMLLRAVSFAAPLGFVALVLAAIWVIRSRRGPTPAAAP